MNKVLQRSFFQNNYTLDVVALVAGGLLPFAFAPYNMYLLAILCPALLLATWLLANPLRALRRGFLFGLSFFGIGIYWIFISIHTFGNTPASIAFIITAGFVVLLAFCIGVSGFIFRRIFPKINALNLTLGFATTWVLMEWLRGWLFTGFPWLFLGYSQIDSVLAGYAPILSVYGVSFIIALSSGLIINGLRNKNCLLYSSMLLLALWLAAWGLSQINWTKPTGKPLTVSLIQGNIAQSIKWNPERLPSTLARYYNLTLENLDHDIIIWPEAAIPIWPSQAKEYIQHLSAQLNKTHASLLTGIPIINDQQTAIYNGALVFGNGQGQYLKRHLVPFGEYVPLQSLLRGLIGFFDLPMSNLSPGSYQQPLIRVAGLPTAVAICYEIAYDSEFISNFPAAKLIVTISDDAWFGYSWAALQQTEISQMRSLETGRYQLVATNNGLSAIIGPKGDIINTAPRFQIAVLNGEVYDVIGNTPINIIGIAPIIISLVLLFIITILLDKKRKKR